MKFMQKSCNILRIYDLKLDFSQFHPFTHFDSGRYKFPIHKDKISIKSNENNGLLKYKLQYATRGTPPFDAETVEKSNLWMERDSPDHATTCGNGHVKKTGKKCHSNNPNRHELYPGSVTSPVTKYPQSPSTYPNKNKAPPDPKKIRRRPSHHLWKDLL